MIRPATTTDSDAIARIYNHYIEHTVVTFEETPVPPTVMAERMRDVEKAGWPWVVTEQHGAIIGFAYAAAWRVRSAYRYSVESTIYLDHAHLTRGTGTALYEHLLGLLAQRGVHVVIGGISLPNEASVALHEKLGYRKVAHFPEVGFKFERWIDVGYWQRSL